MLTLIDLIHESILSELKYLTDKKLLDNRVSSITVMEVPDTYKWIEDYSIVITSLYSIKDCEKEILEILEKLKRNGCTCLAIKTGIYINKISDRVINKANKLGLAMFEIPLDIKYVDIINGISHIFYEDEVKISKAQNVFYNLIFEDYDYNSEKDLVKKSKYYGLDLNSYVFVFSTIGLNENKENNLGNISLSNNEYRYISLQNKDVISFIVFFENKICEKEKYEIISEILKDKKLNKNKFGLSPIYEKIDGLRMAYFDSIKALNIGKILELNEKYFNYRDLEAYITVCDLLNNLDKKDTINKKIKLNKDLYQTLHTYYDYNLNIKKASEALYIHENTLRYRLNKIEEICSYSPYKFKDNLILFINYLLNKIEEIDDDSDWKKWIQETFK